MFTFATQERSDQEPLLLGNGRKTSPKYRVGMFMLTFLFVGAIGSVLLFKQHAPITDAAVGEPLAAAPVTASVPASGGASPDSAPGTPTATKPWDFGDYECPAKDSALMKEYGKGLLCDCKKDKKYGLPEKGMCEYNPAQPDCWPLPTWQEIEPKTPADAATAVETYRTFWACHAGKFTIRKWVMKPKPLAEKDKCAISYFHGYNKPNIYSIFVRDTWDYGDRNGFKRRKVDKDRVMCPPETPICQSDGVCKDTTAYNGAAMSIDLGSGGTRPLLLLSGTEQWPQVDTELWDATKGAFYPCQLNVADITEDLCQGNVVHFYGRTKALMQDVLETLTEINKHREKPLKKLKIAFVVGGVTAGGRDQANTASGGKLVPKLAQLKEDVKDLLETSFAELNGIPNVKEDIIIRMITGQEEAYYAWLDANKQQIMDLAKDPGPLVPVSKETLKTFKNTWERGGASTQFTLTVNADVNTYEDIYKFNLYGQDYYVWADSLVNGGQNRLWDNFMKSVPLKDGTVERPFNGNTDLAFEDDKMRTYLERVDRFFHAQKGLCGDIGLKDFPCITKKKLDDKEQAKSDKVGGKDCVGDGHKSLIVGQHDQMLVQMEQRWTGLCVAGVKIPQTGIAQLDFEAVTDGTPGKPYPKLTWTLATQKLFEHLLPNFGEAPNPAWPKNSDDSECEWWKNSPFHEATDEKKESAATSPDNLTLEDYLSDDGTNFSKIKKFYTNCYKKQNKAFLVALFYTRLFKKIEDGIKESEYGDAKSKPFEHAKFGYESEAASIEWTEAAAWMQVYNNRVRSLFTTTTKKAIELASSGSLEETIGSSFILQPAELPGSIIDLDSFEH